MSGIFGLVNLGQEYVAVDDLKPLSRALLHRGPDGIDVWVKGPAGLGHLKNFTTFESQNEQLPWFDAASGLCITADARLDNRDDLQAELGLDNLTAELMPDCKFILAAFQKWRENCVEHLLGDFAFVIWEVHSGSLFMARDHTGTRPFYYHLNQRVFAFASSALAVTRAEGVPAQIDEGRVADFLVDELEGINNTITFFKQVYRLPPAHFAWLERGCLALHRYWQPDPARELQLGNDADYTDAFDEVLSQAIRARLRSHRAPASMLSGGADSSTVTGISLSLRRREGLDGFTSYSGVSDEESGCIESRYIGLMAKLDGLSTFRLSPADVRREWHHLKDYRSRIEDPFDASDFLIHLLYRRARDNGNSVVLDGVDGDIMTGITSVYIAYLVRQGNWANALREIRNNRLHGMGGRESWLSAHWRAMRPAFTPGFVRRLKYRNWEANWNRRSMYAGVLSRDFVRQVNFQERWREYREQSTRGFCPTLRHAHAEAMVVPYVIAAIERYTRTASCYGVEARQPFQDRRVMEFCLSLPWQQKVRNGHYKYCLRTVLERYAPPEVAWRNQFDSVMWKFSEQRYLLEKQENLEVLHLHRQRLLNMVDQKVWHRMIEGCAANEFDALSMASRLVTLLSFIDGSGAESPV